MEPPQWVINMRAAIWFLTLFSVAVALATAAQHPGGLVSVFLTGYRVDVSINLAILITVTAFILLYVAIRGVSTLLALPKIAKRWRLLQRERSTHESLLNALEQLLTGRYVRSIGAATKAVESANSLKELSQDEVSTPKYLNQLIGLAHLIGAESAHELRDFKSRDQHLQALLIKFPATDASSGGEIREASLLSAARWSLSDADPLSALGLLGELKGGAARRTLTLRLKLKSDRLAKHQKAALETARLLNKHGAFSQNAASGLLKSLCISSLDECNEPEQLIQIWKMFSLNERALPDVAVHAGEKMVSLNGSPQTALLWISPVWDLHIQKPGALSTQQIEKLIQTLSSILKALGPDKTWLAKVDQARVSRPTDPNLQFLSAMACMHNGLWGKAQQLMQEASRNLIKPSMKKQAWLALAQLATQRGDEAEALSIWKKIALIA